MTVTAGCLAGNGPGASAGVANVSDVLVKEGVDARGLGSPASAAVVGLADLRARVVPGCAAFAAAPTLAAAFEVTAQTRVAGSGVM